MQTINQISPTSANAPPILPTGYDGGNGSIKLVVDNAETRIPSYFLPLHNEIYDVPDNADGSFVEYLGGDRADLIGQRWLVGSSAYQIAPQSYVRIVDSLDSKIRLGLQMFLGALATLPHRPKWELSVVASIQDSQAFGTELAQTLAGKHLFRINNQGVSAVNMAVASVAEEGAGAIVSALSFGLIQPRTQNITIDLGNGTIIASIFGSGGKLVARKVALGGVDALIESIARSIETRRQLMKEGDRNLIRIGIENGSFRYGSSGWNFRSTYHNELKPWVAQNLAIALKSVEPWRDQSDQIVAIGGGTLLPAIAALLNDRGIATTPDAVWLNCRGLARLAQIKLRRGM